jgi:hypothetical protein
MFAGRYWTGDYWAGRYWPHVAGSATIPTGTNTPGTVAVAVLPLGAEAPIPGDMLRFGNSSAADGAAPFADLDGTATDPDTVTLTIRQPDGSLLAYGWPSAGADGTLTRESAGRFYADIIIGQSGMWDLKLAGTGAVTAAGERALHVAGSAF